MIRNHSIFLLVVAFLISGHSMPAAGKCLLPERHGVSPTSTNTHQFAFSGSTPVHEWDGALNNGSRIDHIGGGVGGKLYTQDGTGSVRYPFHNARGDIMAEFTAGGTLSYHGTYASSGIQQSESGTRSSNYGANGKWEEPAGLINDGYRYRDRNTNTFITPDPAGFIDGPNTYNYVRHNPWSAWDPNGLATSLLVPTGTADIGYTGPDFGPSSTSTNPGGGVPSLSGSDMAPSVGVPDLSDLLSDLGWFSELVRSLAYPPQPPASVPHGLHIAAISMSPSELTKMARSGNYSPEESDWLKYLSQAKSDAEVDYSIASGTTQGVLIAANPEGAVLKGLSAAIIAIRGISYIDDAVRLGSKADGLVGHLGSSAANVGGSKVGAGLTGSIRDSFTGGRYQRFVLDEDIVTYRASDYMSNSSRVGDFFGDTRPLSALDAEELYNIKLWGNNAHNLGSYRIKAGTEVYFGPVQGGAGQQFYIPNAQGLLGDQIEFLRSESLYRTLPSFR